MQTFIICQQFTGFNTSTKVRPNLFMITLRITDECLKSSIGLFVSSESFKLGGKDSALATYTGCFFLLEQKRTGMIHWL